MQTLTQMSKPYQMNLFIIKCSNFLWYKIHQSFLFCAHYTVSLMLHDESYGKKQHKRPVILFMVTEINRMF